MPTYEGSLLIRCLQKTETAKVLKKAAESIFLQGGFIRKIENLGEILLPCRMRKQGKLHTTANHFILYFDAPPASIINISIDYNRDNDMLRNKIYKANEPVDNECTFYEENLPPPYRKNVQEILKKMPKEVKNKFKYNNGLNYYPFGR